MTAQEIFDKVCEHLAQQGCRSIHDGQCLYRGPDGLMCAIGVIIPDSDERLHLYDDGNPTEPLEKYAPKDISCGYDFMDGLQSVHDAADRKGIETGKKMAARLKNIATSYGLNSAKASLLETVDWKG